MVFIFYSGTGASQLLNNAPDKDIYVIHIQIFVFVSYSGTRSFTSPSFRPKHNTSVSGGNGLPKEAFLLSDNLYDDKRESIFCANWLYSCSLHWFGTLGFLSNSK